MFSLDQLRAFVAVAEELHFGRAAERLNMTQPPLSRQIQKLEKSIKVQLFHRDNRHVALTPAGKAFLTEARSLLAHAQSAPDLARRISDGSSGLIRIGFTAGSSFGLLGKLLAEITEELDGISIDLREMVSSEQHSSLELGQIDIGLGRPPVDTRVFDTMTVEREELVVAVPSGHKLCSLGRPVTPCDIAAEPMVMHSPIKARYFYDLSVRAVPTSSDNVAHTASQILTIIALVSGGHGIAMVPESSKVMGYQGVQYLEFKGDIHTPVELQAVWKKGFDNPALGRVLDLLERRFTEMTTE
ncbi:LysR family transcriptional regulator [Arthrobacter sp. AQ5-05]|uniref:LysR family transcriptional regulator n=1 Tax=Arthrobacter sp. AQ5-05 TaxID=2184581 RepID=UPI000DCAF346|nr:LysR family transcriptional regulator [Arthrobacter sp. AQ5-05]RAX49566.1 LysR family transcriptional regulator [Arthrobacter sp. AQ5-05]